MTVPPLKKLAAQQGLRVLLLGAVLLGGWAVARWPHRRSCSCRPGGFSSGAQRGVDAGGRVHRGDSFHVRPVPGDWRGEAGDSRAVHLLEVYFHFPLCCGHARRTSTPGVESPKIPFLSATRSCSGWPHYIYWQGKLPLGHWELGAMVVCVALVRRWASCPICWNIAR